MDAACIIFVINCVKHVFFLIVEQKWVSFTQGESPKQHTGFHMLAECVDILLELCSGDCRMSLDISDKGITVTAVG